MALGHVFVYNGTVLAVGKLVKWKGECQAINSASALHILEKKFKKDVKIHPNSRAVLKRKFLTQKEKVML